MDLIRRQRILIAEDNQELALTLSMLLKHFGFEVETVHDGGHAVTIAKTRRPDVIVLDIGLPGLDGYEVARLFRSDERLKDVRIIGVSGYAPDMFPERFKAGDFDYYLIKPVDFRTLLPLIVKEN